MDDDGSSAFSRSSSDALFTLFDGAFMGGSSTDGLGATLCKLPFLAKESPSDEPRAAGVFICMIAPTADFAELLPSPSVLSSAPLLPPPLSSRAGAAPAPPA